MQVTVHPMTFSSLELKSIPQRHAAFFMSSCLAASEISTFLRLYLAALTSADLPQCVGVTREYASVQISILQRKLASTLIECVNLLENYMKVCSRKRDDVFPQFLRTTSAVVAQIKADAGHSYAVELRNKVAHHFDFAHITKLLGAAKEERQYTIYLHETDGNCLYPVADHLILANLFEMDNGEATYHAFDDRVRQTASQLMIIHNTFCINLWEKYFSEKFAESMRLDVPDALIPNVKEMTLPIMVDTSQLQSS
ncbi:hypothetical protein HFO61_30970 [Rhizobium leguminosarum]|uniref:hypothetical protein n=1 Tax=Rhizobium leguminosarum TaxID=384 RepID=UPI001C96C7BC|nr:hypothetical protein [Rhizobium leguminosarum]MBY5551167.1 hypothetical protein [Rhizobium leguminosarum]MBY5645317.1 hypothetical protein [Rhizobium leguminosarum]